VSRIALLVVTGAGIHRQAESAMVLPVASA